MWTVNDFPVYKNLFSYCTKEKVACPVCGTSTCSRWLKFCRKFSYTGNKRFLPSNHPLQIKNDGSIVAIKLEENQKE